MEKLANKKIDIICFIILCIIVFLVFFPWITKGHLSTDDYTINGLGYENYKINNSLNDGRLFMVLFIDFAVITKMPIIVFSQITLIISLIISNITVYILKDIVYQKIKKHNLWMNILLWIVSFSIVYNFTYIDNLYYVESIIMAISMLCSLLAAKFFTDKNKNYLIKTVSMLGLSVINYQFMIVTFMIYVIVFDVFSNKSLKEIIKEIFISGFLVLVMLEFGVILIRVIQRLFINVIESKQYRLNHFNIIRSFDEIPFYVSELIRVFKGFLYNAHGLLYNNCVWLNYLIICSYVAILAIINKSKKYFAVCMILIILSFVLSYGFHLFMNYATTAGRMKSCMGMLFGILSLYSIFEISSNSNNKKFKLEILSLMVISYTLLNMISFNDLVNQNIKINEIEKEMGKEVKTAIQQSEEEGDTISNLNIIYDLDGVFKKYQSTKYRESNITRNAFTCEWSIRGALKCFDIDTIVQDNVCSLYKEQINDFLGQINNWFVVENNTINVGVWEV